MVKITISTTVEQELLEKIRSRNIKIPYLISLGWIAHEKPSEQETRILDLENCVKRFQATVQNLKHRLNELEVKDDVLETNE